LRYLLVTGELAKDYVKMYADKSNIEYDLAVVPFPVAALLTPKFITEHLKKRDLSVYDAIIVPGLLRGSSKYIEESLGVPTFKGPKDAADLPTVMKHVRKGLKLSHDIPACELLKEEMKRDAEEELNEILERVSAELDRSKCIEIRGLCISKELPIRVVAEIVDAPKLTRNEIKRITAHYIESGADIIDIGVVAGQDDSSRIKEIVQAVREVTDAPISIDSISPKEIEAAIEAGVDMVVSLERSNMEVLHDIVRDKVCVVIPYDYASGYFPNEPEERVKAMEENIRIARRYGINKILADLIVHPIHAPSFTKSLVSFYEFSKRNPDVQLFMGIGNVSELVDADSHGVNAQLVALASELNASMVLTTEASDKTYGSVWEVSQAVKMMYLSKRKGTFPKDLGIDLLILKEKTRKDFKYESHAKIMEAAGERKIQYDKRGFFRIWVDREKGKICAMHFRWDNLKKPELTICGRRASDIYLEIFDLGLVSDYSHAAYLGKELEKAELALKLRKSYVQDSDLFQDLGY